MIFFFFLIYKKFGKVALVWKKEKKKKNHFSYVPRCSNGLAHDVVYLTSSCMTWKSQPISFLPFWVSNNVWWAGSPRASASSHLATPALLIKYNSYLPKKNTHTNSIMQEKYLLWFGQSYKLCWSVILHIRDSF